MTARSLEGRVALVSGAAGGIGEANAAALTAHGARVVIADMRAAEGEALAARLPGAFYQHLDVTSEAQWQEAVAVTIDRFGRLDILVNNAGIVFVRSIADTSPDDFSRMLDINLRGTFLGMRAVLPAMKERGGAIINIGSVAAMTGPPNMSAYAASKWGVRGLTRSAAIEFAPYRIRVNTICPGLIETPMSKGSYDAERMRRRSARIPVGRAGQPQDIAEMVVFLASDAASFCNGADILCDGGETVLNMAGLSGLA